MDSGPDAASLRENNQVHLRLITGNGHPADHVGANTQTLQRSFQAAGGGARLLKISSLNFVLKPQGSLVRLNILKNITGPVPSALLFLVIYLEFLEQTLDNITLGYYAH